MAGAPSHTRQMIGSLLVALVIVAVAIVVVTARFGPTSAADREALEERKEQRAKDREDAAKRLRDRRDRSGRDGR